jgi:hypothetical protein
MDNGHVHAPRLALSSSGALRTNCHCRSEFSASPQLDPRSLDSLLPVISSTMSQRPQASHRSNVMLSSVDFSRHTKSRQSLCYRLYCPISGPWDLGLAFADRKFVTHPLNRLSTRTSRLLFPIISQLCCLCVCIVQPARFAALAFSSFAVSRHVSSLSEKLQPENQRQPDHGQR